MADATIAAQEASWGQNNVVQPYLVQTEAEVNEPDFSLRDDERYSPNYTWMLANQPRYGDEESWIASAPDGYKEQNIFDASVIAEQRAQYGQSNTMMPYLAQTGSSNKVPRGFSFAQQKSRNGVRFGPYEKNAAGEDTGKVNEEYLRFVNPEAYHDDHPEAHSANLDGELDYDHDGDYEIPDTLKDEIKEEARTGGVVWGRHSEHRKPTYPILDDDAKELNFPGSIVEEQPSQLDAKIQNQTTPEDRGNMFLHHFPGEVFKNGDGFVKVLTAEMARNPKEAHGMYYPDHTDEAVFEPIYDDYDNNGIPDEEEEDDWCEEGDEECEAEADDDEDDDDDESDDDDDDFDECEEGDEECEEAADAEDEEEDEADADDEEWEYCEEGDEECEAEADAEEEEDAAADEEEEVAAALAARKNGDIYAKIPQRKHFRPSQMKPKQKELHPLFAKKEVKAGNEKDAIPQAKQQAIATAQLSNQERLYHHIARRTYPEWDSESYLEPYDQSEHAWTPDHYDMSNETHWVGASDVAGYKIPITADDADSFVQKARRTYPEWDSESYLEPYNQAEHAWTADHYDMSNETHWVGQSDVAGYKIPITADDADSLVQRKRRTYPEWDSESYLEPYDQSEHAWTPDHYDMSNETHWVGQSDVAGYKIPITADDDDSFAQRRSSSVKQGPALAQWFAWDTPYGTPIVDANGDPLHDNRVDAWTDEHWWASDETQWTNDAPTGYLEPVNGVHSFAQQQPVPIAEAMYKVQRNQRY